MHESKKSGCTKKMLTEIKGSRPKKSYKGTFLLLFPEDKRALVEGAALAKARGETEWEYVELCKWLKEKTGVEPDSRRFAEFSKRLGRENEGTPGNRR